MQKSQLLPKAVYNQITYWRANTEDGKLIRLYNRAHCKNEATALRRAKKLTGGAVVIISGLTMHAETKAIIKG